MRPDGRVLLNDFSRLWAEIGEDVLHAVAEVGASGHYILGPQVAAFESSLATLAGLPGAVGCGSGLDAIEIGLRALDMPAGAKVLTTPLSAFATTLAIVRAGGIPVFVDVDAQGLLDLDQAQQELARDASIKFMVPVHLYGFPISPGALAAMGERFGVAVVEDCAQAILAEHSAAKVGTAGAGAAFSFYPTKNLGALGDGGAFLAKSPAVIEHARVLRDYGQTERYVHARLGLNSRLDELHAAVMSRAQLPRLRAWTERRRQIAQRYLHGLAGSAVQTLPVEDGSAPVWHLFPVLAPLGRREELRAFLAARAVQTGVHYPFVIPSQKALAGVPFACPRKLANAEAFAAREVSLPIHPFLTDGEVDRVIDAVSAWDPGGGKRT
jgi:dTDP-3-amino-3,4,6-trideoxy-alpha-D-glucose transaminase